MPANLVETKEEKRSSLGYRPPAASLLAPLMDCG